MDNRILIFIIVLAVFTTGASLNNIKAQNTGAAPLADGLAGYIRPEYLTTGGAGLQDFLGASAAGFYEHHSCSFTRCFRSCMDTRPDLGIQGGNNIDWIAQNILESVISCTGGSAARHIFQDAQTVAGGTRCGVTCAQANQPNADNYAIAQCGRCVVTGVAGSVPGAGCAVGLINAMGDILDPVAYCTTECSLPPHAWEQDWGHQCHDQYSQSRNLCFSTLSGGSYGCNDCQYMLGSAFT